MRQARVLKKCQHWYSKSVNIPGWHFLSPHVDVFWVPFSGVWQEMPNDFNFVRDQKLKNSAHQEFQIKSSKVLFNFRPSNTILFCEWSVRFWCWIFFVQRQTRGIYDNLLFIVVAEKSPFHKIEPIYLLQNIRNLRRKVFENTHSTKERTISPRCTKVILQPSAKLFVCKVWEL